MKAFKKVIAFIFDTTFQLFCTLLACFISIQFALGENKVTITLTQWSWILPIALTISIVKAIYEKWKTPEATKQ
ncbi:hypothetical protein ACVRY7_03200 [Streptococcus ictaluri]|uniref:Lipoprotein n=1 Tax=Streptococcus ictaluri 707-05 TaxID=764299 RepID=G5K0R7_9STRE|nr:hypothetical protein [Streptococcus ictaluri]EHI70490.1 hypothetical protein STRIC_0193 [Streptococcus ictaluri 707-05]